MVKFDDGQPSQQVYKGDNYGYLPYQIIEQAWQYKNKYYDVYQAVNKYRSQLTEDGNYGLAK